MDADRTQIMQKEVLNEDADQVCGTERSRAGEDPRSDSQRQVQAPAIRRADVLLSSKREGAYEARIIRRLVPFFENMGFEAVPHARLNIAWGNIISDIDLLLIKDGTLGAVEVKSSRDNMRRAGRQIDGLRDFVGFVYVATDYTPRRFRFRTTGLHSGRVRTRGQEGKKPELQAQAGVGGVDSKKMRPPDVRGQGRQVFEELQQVRDRGTAWAARAKS